jgi:hypothetical protein
MNKTIEMAHTFEEFVKKERDKLNSDKLRSALLPELEERDWEEFMDKNPIVMQDGSEKDIQTAIFNNTSFCISKLGITGGIYKSRMDFLRMNFRDMKKRQISSHWLHMLGLNSTQELLEMKDFFPDEEEITVDSCLPALYASENKKLGLFGLKDRIETPKDFFDRVLTADQQKIYFDNLQFIRELIEE